MELCLKEYRLISVVSENTLFCVSLNLYSSLPIYCIYHSGPVSITVSYLDIELVVTANNKIIEIEVFTRNIQLECNRDICIWYNVDNLGIYTVVGNSITYTIQYITIENNKQYVLSTQDNSGLFVPAASIRIRPIGMLFNFFKININNGTTYIGRRYR